MRAGVTDRENPLAVHLCVGTCVVSLGRTCRGYRDCRDGEYCGETTHCEQLPKLGARCEWSVGCARGLTCDTSTPDGSCTGIPGASEVCFGKCARGFACEVLEGRSKPRVCRTAVPLGAPCSFQGACEEGLLCVGSVHSVSMNGPHRVQQGVCMRRPDVGDGRCFVRR